MRSALIHLLVLLTLISVAGRAAAQPVRLAATFGDDEAQLEVRDLRTDKAEAAIGAAIGAMQSALDLIESPDGPRAQLHRSDQSQLIDIDDGFANLLARAQQFCMWSNGAFGPLAGRLAALRMMEETGEQIELAHLEDALASANCANVAVRAVAAEGPVGPDSAVDDSANDDSANDDSAADADVLGDLRAVLAEGSRIDLRGWSRGFAVDRAVEVLKEHGAGNLWVELGPVRRALGGGPKGEGWPVILSFPGVDTPVASIYLRDRAMAVAMPLLPRGERDPLYIDQRNGRRASGFVAVAVVAELALDAEALGATFVIVGLNEGKMRLASLKPQPSALVLLGTGENQPVRSDFRWLELPQMRLVQRSFP